TSKNKPRKLVTRPKSPAATHIITPQVAYFYCLIIPSRTSVDLHRHPKDSITKREERNSMCETEIAADDELSNYAALVFPHFFMVLHFIRMATQTEAPSTTPSVQVVGNAFVEQYYHILHHSPNMVHKFYQDASFISRPDEDGTMITVTTMKGINDKICSLDYTAYKAEIKTADAQESYKDGVIVLVTGSLTRKEDDQRRKFIQSFFLAPQDKGYFVLNDVFRYVDESKPMEDNYVVVEGIDDKQTPPLIADPPRTIDSPSPDLASVHKEETQNVEEEAQDVTENEGLLANENNSVEPEPYPSENNMSSVAESISSIAVEDAPKMSYASILSSQTKKGGPGPTKVYVPTLRTAPAKTENISVATVAQGPPPEVPAPIASSSISSPDSSNVHNEGDGHSIYIRNLPLNATVSQLEMEFKKFGPIKQGGIQVRSNKQLGFCFGFVEFQDFSSMQNAIQVRLI
ncbi:Nuclear transport factor 2, partial [Cynara cardunculus var. scolymus]